jgi:undecaprenyl-diphosphatase
VGSRPPAPATAARLDAAVAGAAGRLVGRWGALDLAMIWAARYLAAVDIALLLALLVGGRGRPARRRRAAALRTAIALPLAVWAVAWTGRRIERTRPFAARADGATLLPHGPRRSFPSRHAACAATMATITLPADPTIGRLMAGVGGLLSVSRVYVGLHYPSDVAAGWLIGLAIGRLMRGPIARADPDDGAA